MQSTRITYTSATVPSLSRRLASTAVPPPPAQYHLPYTQALTVGEMRCIDMMLTLIICSAALLLYVTVMCHISTRGKKNPPRSASYLDRYGHAATNGRLSSSSCA